MLSFFKKSKKIEETKDHRATSSSRNPDVAPPEWAPAPERSYQYGKYGDAPGDEYEAGEEFCMTHPLSPPRLLPSHIIDRIQSHGGRAWGIEYPSLSRFSGTISNDNKGGPGVVKVQTTPECGDVCLMSDLPILAGLYDTYGKTGVYYEIQIHRMKKCIAVGTACRPYPEYRLPGWNRQSAGLHLDDMRKFFEDPDGGRDYTSDRTRINPGDTIGCGYEFTTGSLFYTHNGCRLPEAFNGLYLPRQNFDVFAAVGVEGECDFDVNFGGDYFKWKDGNEWAWKIEGHVGGNIASGSGLRGEVDEELPAYSL
ncbi:Protein ssh4 [Leucoagaricus sp. SymC.cos]|nr:Protein ssh4 [Leucoagaricus sp. SymC.cos]